ncbi:MAG: hypothetical protein Q6363_010200 [Candidatus Njordarchaeota archaeon]
MKNLERKSYWRHRIAGVMFFLNTTIFDIFVGDPKFLKRFINTSYPRWFEMYVFAFYGIFCILTIIALIISGVNWRVWFYYAVLLYTNWVDTLWFIMQGKMLPKEFSWLPYQSSLTELLIRNAIGIIIIVIAELIAKKRGDFKLS